MGRGLSQKSQGLGVTPKADSSELGELVSTFSKFFALDSAAGLNGEQFRPRMMGSVNFSPRGQSTCVQPL